MRFTVLSLGVTLGAILALPGVSGAQGPTEDSVLASGTIVVVPVVTPHTLTLDVRARSGPSGENPTGGISLSDDLLGTLLTGPVTCLAVDGNRATVQFDTGHGIASVVVSDSPDSIVLYERATADCMPFGQGTQFGDAFVTIVDAQPLPTSKEQCINGGWRNYPGFTNQGDCVSFVATGGKNPPAQKSG
jgi:hypothetical protein